MRKKTKFFHFPDEEGEEESGNDEERDEYHPESEGEDQVKFSPVLCWRFIKLNNFSVIKFLLSRPQITGTFRFFKVYLYNIF